MTVGGCKLLPNEMAAVGVAISFGGTLQRIFNYLLHRSIDMSFVTENNKGDSRYIMGKFEDFLSFSSRENALRVTRLVNMLCRSLLAKI